MNAPSLCVVAGPFDALEELEQTGCAGGVACRRLVTSHAFHSAMMDPIVEPFTKRVAQVRLRAPKIPYVSGATGTWITGEQATDPSYWARHFRQPVQFAGGLAELRKAPNSILLEVGPGNVLATLARQQSGVLSEQPIVSFAGGWILGRRGCFQRDERARRALAGWSAAGLAQPLR